MKINRVEKYPWSVTIPKTAIPMPTIYKKFSIVRQDAVLNTFEGAPNVIRSAKPFAIRILNKKGFKILEAKEK